jgi:hypothetical protein
MRARVAVLGLVAALAAAAPARAGDPIMPLGDVGAGMRCTGYTVVRGIDVSAFDVDVLDVVDRQPGEEARILVRVSGPAVDATGIGPGFSGSPVYCPDAQGVARNAGALSETVGEYGNHTVLVTPIEQVLGESPDPPRGIPGARRAPRSARSLAGPLTVSGVSPGLGRVLAAAARRAGRTLIAVPAGPAGSFPVRPLRPGSAVSIGYSSGDVALGAQGTVAYVDGDRVWAFGHALDGVGARSLILQDAYVYGVVGNPVGLGEAITYKLAAPGHDVGMLTNDALDAVVGRVGVLPDEIALRVLARDEDTGRAALTDVQVADETALGDPSGVSPLLLAGGAALVQAGTSILHGSPSRLSGGMCLRIRARERAKPMGFCNRYVGRGGGGMGGDPGPDSGSAAATQMLADFTDAVTLLDSYQVGPLHTTGVTASMRLARGLRQGFLLRATAPARARRGGTVRVRALVRVVRGPLRRIVMRVRVPVGTPSGSQELVLTGAPEDSPEADLGAALSGLITATLDVGGGSPGDGLGPRSLEQLARKIGAIQRYDGVRARFLQAGERAPSPDEPDAPGAGARTHRDRSLRISGQARVQIDVVGARRHGRAHRQRG